MKNLRKRKRKKKKEEIKEFYEMQCWKVRIYAKKGHQNNKVKDSNSNDSW